MKISLEALVRSLLEVEEEKTFTPAQVNEYVLRHIYEPLLRDDEVLFSELDFMAFGDSDLSALEDMLEECQSIERQLVRLNALLCEAPPVSTPARTFC